jgi:RNA polymerase sigma factor (sigma-70 family)
MADRTNGIVLRLGQLLRLADANPDAELLDRFIAGRDGDAFALLVRRHGPMVHGVCRRILRNHADADDAFQATFLVLARRARVVHPRALLGNWLYGVAYRTALESKRAAAVRRARERSAAEMRTPTTTNPVPPDLREVLDRELATLPDVYRAAVILCDLEGLSRKEAAERLGWLEGTLSGRLARARSMLAARLSRHGLAVPAAGLGLCSGTAAAEVPAALVESTARIGVLLAAGEAVAVAPAPVAALMEGVMKAMLLTKLKATAMTVVVGCAILATAIGGWQANAAGAGDTQAAERARAAAQPRSQPRDADKDRIAELERERDLLLRQVRELRDRLAKLEAALGGRGGEGADNLLDVAKKLRFIEEERAKLGRGSAAKGPGEDPLTDLAAKLRLLEEQREKEKTDLLRKIEAERWRVSDTAKDPTADPAASLRRFEAERARAAGAVARPGDDRVATIEDKLKMMADELQKLRMEVERLRKK